MAVKAEYQVDVAPMREWLEARTAELERLYPVSVVDVSYGAPTTQRRLLQQIGWDDEAGARRLYRWMNKMSIVDIRVVDAALDHAGVSWFDVYPAPEDAGDDDADEEFCFACRAFVTPIGGCCAWCDRPVQRVDLRNLPPRPESRPAPEPPPPMRVRYRPRVKKGKPFYFDVDLKRRRQALEVFTATGSLEAAADASWQGLFSCHQSCYASLRRLLVREGWYEPTGARGPHAWPELRKAVPRVSEALCDGSWDRVPPEVASPSQRRVVDERLVRDAVFEYFVQDRSFREAAEILLARSGAASAKTLKTALIDEWDRRGWPRRTTSSAAMWRRPTGSKRCRAVNEHGGKRCRRYASNGGRFCFAHDPATVDLRTENAIRASRAATPDLVPVEPFAFWLRHRRRELGSLKAVHRRVSAAISYDSLTRWAQPWGEVGTSRQTVVRRATVDRILREWGDGTTFEDVYMPVESDDAVLVPAMKAAA